MQALILLPVSKLSSDAQYFNVFQSTDGNTNSWRMNIRFIASR
jgi:hypothetical protein